jgi:hypothetical protein
MSRRCHAFSALEHLCAHARSIVWLGRERLDRLELVADHALTLRADRRASAGRSSATWPRDWYHWKPRHRRSSLEKTALWMAEIERLGPHAASAWPPGQEEGPHDRPPDRPARGGAATRLQREHRKAAWHPNYQT